MLNKALVAVLETTAKMTWSHALKLGRLQNQAAEPLEADMYRRKITEIREQMGELARASTAPTVVEFGTSGWRGRIGEDFTIHNVHKVTRAIIDTMRTPEFL
ncbi:alpha-D-phosphohexomutase superfamily, partial [Candidatus Termititenax persephonae]